MKTKIAITFGSGIALALIIIAPIAHAQTINNPTSYFKNDATDGYAIVSLPVTTGDTINIWGSGSQSNGCGTNTNESGTIAINKGSGSTTVAWFGYDGNQGAATCNAGNFYSTTTTSTGTWYIQTTSGWGINQTLVTDYSATTTSGGGTGTSTTNNIYGQQIATTSQNAIEVDNPIQDLFEGFIILFIVIYFIVWSFKKR